MAAESDSRYIRAEYAERLLAIEMEFQRRVDPAMSAAERERLYREIQERFERGESPGEFPK